MRAREGRGGRRGSGKEEEEGARGRPNSPGIHCGVWNKGKKMSIVGKTLKPTCILYFGRNSIV